MLCHVMPCIRADGRRCVLGSGGGEYSLWNASTLTSESVMSLHDGAPVRCITYTHSQQFFVGCDDRGQVRIFSQEFKFMSYHQVSDQGR